MAARSFERYVGKPFVADGHGPTGYNCWGLICLVLREQKGIVLERYRDIAAGQALAMLRRVREQERSGAWLPVQKGEQQPFDVVIMNGGYMNRQGDFVLGAIHIGLFVTPAEILHTEFETDSVLLDVHHPDFFPSRIIRIWRHRSLA